VAHGMVELRLLGRFVVLREGAEVSAAAFGGRKVRALLRMLAVQRGRLVPLDVLAEWLWPDRAPADPSANVQVLVNRIRRAVGRPDLVVTGSSGYALTDAPWCVVDTETLLAELRRAQGLSERAALAVYRTALAGGDVEPLAEDRYAGWAEPFRDEIVRARQAAWERAADLAITADQPTLAVEWAAAAARAEPLREVAVLTLVRALAAAGDRAAALARYDAYRRLLREELGLDPSPVAAELQARLLGAESGSASTTRRSSRTAAFAPLRFVGRRQDVAAIVGILSGSGDRPRVICIAGRSGAGKSRLLAEVGQAVPATYVRAFWSDRDEPWSLASVLLGELAASDVAVVDALPEQLRTALAFVLPDLAQGGPAVAAETRRALILEAGVRVASALAGGLVLLVDDLQWADPTSLRLLAALVERVPGVGIVLAYRPDEIEPAGAVAHFLNHLEPVPTLRIGGLPESAWSDLVTDPALARALDRGTDRTPMAITEVLRRLAADEIIARDPDGRWRPAAPNAVERAAELGRLGQRRAIARRIAGCMPEERAVVRLLGLLGRASPARILAAAVPVPEARALEVLTALSTVDLVRQTERGWGVAHDMVAEVVRTETSAADRALLQARLATVLEAEDGDPAERARLWSAAGDSERAAQAYATAAQVALDTFADAEAERLADAGLATVGNEAGGAGPRLRLLEARAHARQRLGSLSGARADLQAALEGYRSGPARSRVLADLAMLALGADDPRRAAELAELALVEASTDRRAAARALEVASVADMNLDRPDRAEARANEALARYTELGDSRGAARILDARAMATFLEANIRTGTELLDRAAHLFEDSGDLMRTVTPRSTRGHGLVLLDHAVAGLADARQALEIARTLGHPEGQAYALWHCAEALAVLGRADEAVAAGNQARALATRIDHRGWTATAWRAIGLGRQAAGDLEAALAAYQQSLALADHLDLFACWAAARAALVQVALGRCDDAAPLVDRALALGPALGQHEARWAAAELAVARGDDSARRVVLVALDAAERGGALVYRPRLFALRDAAGGTAG
jgi:DNA-binding SARP family transcriptional activator/tetratricopeptide (TPR) repeat protein